MSLDWRFGAPRFLMLIDSVPPAADTNELGETSKISGWVGGEYITVAVRILPPPIVMRTGSVAIWGSLEAGAEYAGVATVNDAVVLVIERPETVAGWPPTVTVGL